MRIFERHLFERFPEDGGSDAGAVGDAGAAADAAPAADSTPASSASSATSLDTLPYPDVPGLTDQAGDASGASVDGQPAGGGSGAEGADGLAAEQEPLPFDDDATLEAFLEEYGDRIAQHPKVLQRFSPLIQGQVDRQLAERDALPINDERYVAETTREQAALNELAAELTKMQAGEAADPQIVAKAALASRGAIKQASGIELQRAADAVTLMVTSRLNEEAAADLFTPELRDAYAEADLIFARLHGAMTRDRAGNVVPDERARARAFPEYDRRRLEVVVAAAKEAGRREERAAKTQSTANRDTLAKSNMRRQMQAGTARATPKPTGASNTPRPALTREVLSAGSWRDTRKAMQAAGETI